MRLGVYGRVLKKRDVKNVQKLFDLLSHYEISCVVNDQYYDEIISRVSLNKDVERFEYNEDISGSIDYLLSIGGDGTLLDTLTIVKNSGVPILGINTGRLGFLASAGREDIASVVEALLNKHYEIDSRTLIHLDSNKPLFGDVNYALNEFTIHKKDTSSMITIHTYINGELLNSYWADGLIVATPTGSTGYSLSCGGPVIFPSSEDLVITPVAPHNLNVRPIVVSNNSVLSFVVEGRSEFFQCTLDSRYATIDASYELAIRKEDFNINLMRINNNDFLQTIRTKLLWGLDQRN